MTSYTWGSAVSGTWSTAADWTPSGVPSSSADSATIDATGATYTVSYDETSETIDDLTVDSATATLAFDVGQTLTVDGATMLLAGTIDLINANAVLNAGSLTISPGAALVIGNSSKAESFNGTTYYGASVSGVVDLVSTAGSFGSTSATLTLSGTIEATGGTGTVSFASISGSGTFEAAGATLVVASSLASSTVSNVISNSASSVFETTGPLYYGSSLSISFLGPNGEFQYNDPSSDSHVIFDVSGLNVGPSKTAPTNFLDFAGESLTITSGGTGTGSTGSVVLSNGDTLTLSAITGGAGGWVAEAVSAGGGTEVFLAVCFAAGTRILTPSGERAVETLAEGDLVLAGAGDELAACPIKWLGYRRIDLTSHPRPATVAPIRIMCGAISDTIPHNDLCVSPDHGILIDGKLICARQLVNGTTIRQMTGLASVQYFHVELDAHNILLAEGLTAETYLDTGNRGFFANGDSTLGLHPDLCDEPDYPSRERASCEPFVWDEDNVRPIWQRLADRAILLGEVPPRLNTTTDPGLHLVVRGRDVKPLSADAGRHLFLLPREATEVRVVSLAEAPTVGRPWVEDRRRLGVCVERIILRSADDTEEIPIPLDHPGLSQGWWAAEREGMKLRRWTNGDATLPLPAAIDLAVLELHASWDRMSYLIPARQERIAPRAGQYRHAA